MIKRTSRYSQLQGRRELEKKEYYEGVYEGHPIRFNCKFREYKFTLAEFDALCQGEWLEVHNLTNGNIKYGVLGSLEKDMFWKPDGLSSMPVYVFKVRKSLLNNPDYDFKTRIPYYGPDKNIKNGVKQTNRQNDDIMIDSNNTDDENRLLKSLLSDSLSNEEDAKLAAMVAAPNLPPIRMVDNTEGSVPVYVPVLGNMVFSKDGITVLDEHVPQVAPIESVLDDITEKSLNEPIDESNLLYDKHDVALEEGLELTGDDIVEIDEDDEDYDESLDHEEDDLPLILGENDEESVNLDKSLKIEGIFE